MDYYFSKPSAPFYNINYQKIQKKIDMNSSNNNNYNNILNQKDIDSFKREILSGDKNNQKKYKTSKNSPEKNMELFKNMKINQNNDMINNNNKNNNDIFNDIFINKMKRIYAKKPGQDYQHNRHNTNGLLINNNYTNNYINKKIGINSNDKRFELSKEKSYNNNVNNGYNIEDIGHIEPIQGYNEKKYFFNGGIKKDNNNFYYNHNLFNYYNNSLEENENNNNNNINNNNINNNFFYNMKLNNNKQMNSSNSMKMIFSKKIDDKIFNKYNNYIINSHHINNNNMDNNDNFLEEENVKNKIDSYNKRKFTSNCNLIKNTDNKLIKNYLNSNNYKLNHNSNQNGISKIYSHHRIKSNEEGINKVKKISAFNYLHNNFKYRKENPKFMIKYNNNLQDNNNSGMSLIHKKINNMFDSCEMSDITSDLSKINKTSRLNSNNNKLEENIYHKMNNDVNNMDNNLESNSKRNINNLIKSIEGYINSNQSNKITKKNFNNKYKEKEKDIINEGNNDIINKNLYKNNLHSSLIIKPKYINNNVNHINNNSEGKIKLKKKNIKS